jgi:WD40 repeat protein
MKDRVSSRPAARYAAVRRHSLFAVIPIFCAPVIGFSASSSAYVALTGSGGFITPFNTKTGSLGAAYFVPGGASMAVDPGTKQVWELSVDSSSGDGSIEVLNPRSGATLATIPLGASLNRYSSLSLLIDSAGRYAYVSAYDETSFNNELFKLDVSSRSIVQMAATTGLGGAVFSSDGLKLFLLGATGPGVVVVDSASLSTLATIPLPAAPESDFVSGNTLLVTLKTGLLLYFDTGTFQQTNSVTVPAFSTVFGVSSGETQIYLAWRFTIEILDFASGRVLVSQTFPNANLTNLLLSPDKTQIVVASEPVLVIGSGTLTVTGKVESMGVPSAAAYVDSGTVLMLYGGGGTMAVIDQSAKITALFPISVGGEEECEVADLERGVIYAGSVTSVPNVIGGKQSRVIKNLPAPLGFLPGAVIGEQIYGVAGNKPAAFDLATGQTTYMPLPKIPPTCIRCIYGVLGGGSAPPDGKTYWLPLNVFNQYGVLESFGIAVYDTSTKSLITRIVPPPNTGPPSGSTPVAFSPDSTTAYVGSIAVYSTRTLQLEKTFSEVVVMGLLAISPDGATLYGTDGNAIYVLGAATGTQQVVFQLPSPIFFPVANGMALSTDGTTLFLANPTQTGLPPQPQPVYLINTGSGQVTQVQVPSTSWQVVVLPTN